MQELQSPKLSQFLAKMQPYFLGEPKIVSGEKVWNLKQTILADGPVALNAIQVEASSLGITFSRLPSPKFSLKATLENDNDSARLLFLHESDIEDGGPQPRSQIQPNDPETVSLFESIAPIDPNDHRNILGVNQREPIATYPSPLNNGKHRICEGHRRRLVIINLLRLDGIWALEKKRTEQEAFEDALILNNKKSLSVSDRARHYKLMMEKFPQTYPTLEALGKKVGATHQDISLVLLAYKELEAQKPRLSPEISNAVAKLPEFVVREIRKAPEEVKPELYKVAVTDKLTSAEIKTVVENVREEPTSEKVVEEAQKIADDKAIRYVKEADKAVAKTERARDKVVAAGEDYPESLMKAVYGHLGLKGNKVTPEKAKVYASTVVGVLFQRAVEKDEVDEVFREADSW